MAGSVPPEYCSGMRCSHFRMRQLQQSLHVHAREVEEKTVQKQRSARWKARGIPGFKGDGENSRAAGCGLLAGRHGPEWLVKEGGRCGSEPGPSQPFRPPTRVCSDWLLDWRMGIEAMFPCSECARSGFHAATILVHHREHHQRERPRT